MYLCNVRRIVVKISQCQCLHITKKLGLYLRHVYFPDVFSVLSLGKLNNKYHTVNAYM